jgi:hypothetical protein
MRRLESWTWTVPGLAAHMRATGEVAPQDPPGVYIQPVDMVTHGGYAVRVEGRDVAGPFAWVENARIEAARVGGVVVRARKPTPQGRRQAGKSRGEAVR